MRLRLAGGGRFGPLRRPQVAWTGLDGDVGRWPSWPRGWRPPPGRCGLQVEDRPFRAHLTLGPVAPGTAGRRHLTDRLAGYRGPDWPVTEVRLIESHLGPRPTYETVAAWPVGGCRAYRRAAAERRQSSFAGGHQAYSIGAALYPGKISSRRARWSSSSVSSSARSAPSN